MKNESLARLAAQGIAETGIEGAFGSVVRSTAGDWPALGISQWEEIRADALLWAIPGGRDYMGLSYSQIVQSGKRETLSALLSSEEGRRVQLSRLAGDCEGYIDALAQIPTLSDETRVYAAMWCPTSLYTVIAFLKNRAHRTDLADLAAVHRLFWEEYARAADVEIYAEGYRNRAEKTYTYVSSLKL